MGQLLCSDSRIHEIHYSARRPSCFWMLSDSFSFYSWVRLHSPSFKIPVYEFPHYWHTNYRGYSILKKKSSLIHNSTHYNRNTRGIFDIYVDAILNVGVSISVKFKFLLQKWIPWPKNWYISCITLRYWMKSTQIIISTFCGRHFGFRGVNFSQI